MRPPANVMEIFQMLDKSNCRECGSKTCMAFAGAVFKGQKDLCECPKLDKDIPARFSGKPGPSDTIEDNRGNDLEQLKNSIKTIDLRHAAEKCGGRITDDRMSGERLTVKILGKDFSVDQHGNFYADIHVNPWVAAPFLNYVLHGKGRPVTGRWLSFRELKDGSARYPLFKKRSEEAMKKVADTYTDLFDDLVHLFDGQQVEPQFASDISVVLHPLPKVPVMICYWMPDEGLASTLNIFFDESADDNLDIGSLFSLGAGLAQMFEKIAVRHGVFPR